MPTKLSGNLFAGTDQHLLVPKSVLEDPLSATLPPRSSLSQASAAQPGSPIRAAATDLGILKSIKTLSARVSSTTLTQLYQLRLTAASNLNVALTGINVGSDADLRVFADRNQNGAIDANEELRRSELGGRSDEAVNLRSLAVGRYLVQVLRRSGDTPFKLTLSTGSPSELLPTEVNVGSLLGTVRLEGTVSDRNTTDVYRFHLDSNLPLNLALTGLTSDAELRLIRDANNNGVVDSGEVVASRDQDGNRAETINLRSLTAGSYWVQVYHYSGSTSYTLQLSTDEVNNLMAAETLVGPLSDRRSFSATLNNRNTSDIYQFSLTGSRQVDLNLSGLSADLDIRLILDSNRNGVADLSEVLAASAQEGATGERLSTGLQAGSYFVQVYQYSGESSYTLSLRATLPTIADNAGNTLATARNLGVLSNQTQSLTDFVGTIDPDDFYRFRLSADRLVQINLTGLSADADLQLIQDRNANGIVDANEVIASSLNAGTESELLSLPLVAGTYFLRVYPYTGGTQYRLNAAATVINLPAGYNFNAGYGLVNAAAAVAAAIGQAPFATVPNLGGNDWGADLIMAPEVWARGYTGQGVVVAVVDTGVDYTHSDLDANIWINRREIAGNGLDDDNNGFIDDVRGWDFVDQDNNPLDLEEHGTHVAGTIAAENNRTGATGIAYSARIMPVRVLDDVGSGENADVAAGIRYAANNGADVINLSLGGDYDSDIAAAVQYATERGAFVVLAAGNDYAQQPGFPASLASQWGIAVGAVDRTRQLGDFSNRAGVPALNYVVAPGVDIYSTLPNNTYSFLSGTSMATPHVAAVAALMLSANPNLTPIQLTQILTQTANSASITA